MKRCKIDIHNSWTIILFINIDYGRYDLLESDLTDILAPASVIDEIYNKIGYAYDSGFTYSNPNYRISIVGINSQTSREELINTLVHEADHVQAAICDYYHISLITEEAAYLIGDIIKEFYKCSSKLFCNY